MRLAFVANGLSYGGAEKMLSFVATELYKRGHEVAIFNTNEHNGVTQTLPQGVTIFNASIKTKKKKLAFFQRLFFCIHSARQYNPDVVIGFLLYPNLFSVLTGKILRIPSVVSERADPYLENANNSKIDNLLLKIICSSEGAVFQTNGAAMFYPLKLRERSAIIPNPITISKKYKNLDYSKRENIVISLGRIDNHQKRLDILIDAFLLFHQKHPDYVLHMYGGGPDKDFVQQLIIEKQLNDCVFLKGVSKNSFEDISTGKIFAITSDYEGISNSLLEAMAVGMPVVSTDHSPGGARFLITDEKNGLLTPKGDSSKFAEALSRFAEDEDFAIRCGKKATQVLVRFSPNIIVDMWENYLVGLIK